jgi:acyl-coenzyme A synthetase/AMP-(fatty) acid ligase
VVLAAVVGLPDDTLGQRPVGFVTVSGTSPRAEELIAVVASRVSECPVAFGVEIVEDMPMTPTGKISKAQLLARASPV